MQSNKDKIDMKILSAAIDTLDGLEFVYKVEVSNNTKNDIKFYTGLDEREEPKRDGFYFKFKNLEKSYQMISFTQGVIDIPALTKNKGFIIDACFKLYCKDISAFDTIISTYYKSKNKLENIKNLIKDISIEYRVNKEWNDNNYQSAFKSDSIIYFNHIDTVKTEFFTEITGETFEQMLKK